MRLSTSTCIYFNRPDGTKASILESIELCAQAGYKVMDMNFHDCCMFDTPFKKNEWLGWIKSVKQKADECGIVFSQGHSHFYNYCDSEVSNQEILEEYIKRGIKSASILGIPWLVTHAATDFESNTPFKTSKARALEYFKKLLEIAEKYNVGIAIENLWDLNISPKRRYTTTAEELVDLVDTLSKDFGNVGICWDVEHSSIMQQNIEKALNLVGDRLKATHISDYIDIHEDHILPFSGISNWPTIMRALKNINYQGDFTYEIHRYTMRLPIELVPSALQHSVKVGEYLLELN
jgi:sugar phosphate isomerase/epimerase